MTDEFELSVEDCIRAVRKTLEVHVPHADPQDVEEFIKTLEDDDDPVGREMNLGAGFGQLCEDEAATNAAFSYYAELIGALRAKSNPIPKHVLRDGDGVEGEEPAHMEDL